MAGQKQAASLDELIAAMLFVSDPYSTDAAAYLHRPSGRIYWQSADAMVSELYGDEELPKDIQTSPEYLPIPNKRQLDAGKAFVFAFVHQFMPHAYAEVAVIFRKPGAYGRFRDMLVARDLLDRWRQFLEAGEKEAMRNWCRKNGVAFTE
ncbi:MAG: UPF0158 family protein [Desulfobulbaceae bacterium]|jgi:hypothetical protein|nr:UPF0158 family protein [Desulfobulbaceae bacterium]